MCGGVCGGESGGGGCLNGRKSKSVRMLDTNILHIVATVDFRYGGSATVAALKDIHFRVSSALTVGRGVMTPEEVK